MRIIGGRARGVRLDAGQNPAVRPTTDRLKETLFNILGCVEDELVLDVFAGSGSLGLEALSRGAKKVYFIESDRKTVDVIRENYKKVKQSMADECGEAIFICADWQHGLRTMNDKIDIILSDPPYANDSALAKDMLLSEELMSVVHDRSLLVLEHMTVSHLVEKGSWELLKQKNCHPTSFSFFKTT